MTIKIFSLKASLLILSLALSSSLLNAATTDYQFTTTSGFSFQDPAQSQELEALMGGADYLSGLSSSGSFSYTTPDSALVVWKDVDGEFIYHAPINIEADFDGRHFSVAYGAIGSINLAEVYPGGWLQLIFLQGSLAESIDYSFGDYQLTSVSVNNVFVLSQMDEPVASEVDTFLADNSFGCSVQYAFSGPDDSGHYLTANIVVSAVPVPAAAWLFGSALVGLIGIKRQR
jgi:hypothetical protein